MSFENITLHVSDTSALHFQNENHDEHKNTEVGYLAEAWLHKAKVDLA